MITKAEKEQFCTFAAALLAPPDAGLIDDLAIKELRSWLDAYAEAWGADAQILSPFFQTSDDDSFLSALRTEYLRLFDQHEGERISLVESTYKPWTADKSCRMVFAASRGLLMGDSALHMLDLYRESAIEIPDEFRSMPDHLVLQLEFLALLYRGGSEEQTNQFICDHLGWIPELKVELQKAGADDFYRSAIELIELFLQNEVSRQEG